MISTKKLHSDRIKIFWILSLVVQIIFIYVSIHFDFQFVSLLVLVLSIYLFSVILLYWCYFVIKYKVKKIGLKSALELRKILGRIEDELLDAMIFFPLRKEGEFRIVRLPKISFFFDDDDIRFFVENSVKYQDKLERLDLSSALGNYVVEAFYMDENQSRFIYEIENSKDNRRIVFESIEEIKNTTSNPYQIKVDEKLTFRIAHSLVVGNTGAGKSYYFYYLVIAGLLKKWNLYVIDPKNASMALIGKKIGSVGYDRATIKDLLGKYYNSMQKRKEELQERLEHGLELDYSDFGMMPHVLIFDEFATFKSDLKNYEKKERDELSGMIDEIILQGRQLGFFIQIGMQKSDATLLPTYIRNSLLFKMVLWNADRTTYQTTFEETDIPTRKLERGAGWYTLQGKANRPKRVDTPTLNFDIYQAIKELAEVD